MKVSELMEKIKSMKPDDDFKIEESPPAPSPAPPAPSDKPHPVVFTDEQFEKFAQMVAKSLQNSKTKKDDNDDEQIYI